MKTKHARTKVDLRTPKREIPCLREGTTMDLFTVQRGSARPSVTCCWGCGALERQVSLSPKTPGILSHDLSRKTLICRSRVHLHPSLREGYQAGTRSWSWFKVCSKFIINQSRSRQGGVGFQVDQKASMKKGKSKKFKSKDEKQGSFLLLLL